MGAVRLDAGEVCTVTSTGRLISNLFQALNKRSKVVSFCFMPLHLMRAHASDRRNAQIDLVVEKSLEDLTRTFTDATRENIDMFVTVMLLEDTDKLVIIEVALPAVVFASMTKMGLRESGKILANAIVDKGKAMRVNERTTA